MSEAKKAVHWYSRHQEQQNSKKLNGLKLTVSRFSPVEVDLMKSVKGFDYVITNLYGNNQNKY